MARPGGAFAWVDDSPHARWTQGRGSVNRQKVASGVARTDQLSQARSSHGAQWVGAKRRPVTGSAECGASDYPRRRYGSMRASTSCRRWSTIAAHDGLTKLQLDSAELFHPSTLDVPGSV